MAEHPAAILLFSGWRDGNCRNAELYAIGEAGVLIPGDVQPAHEECAAEIVAFSSGSGVVAHPWPVTPFDDAWIEAGTLRLRLPPPRSIPIHLWVLTSEPVVPDWALEQVRYANDLLSFFGTGFRLDAVLHLVAPDPDVEASFRAECGGVQALKDRGLTEGGALNAYLYVWDEGLINGVACALDPSAPDPAVLFVYSGDLPRHLVHEVGHALGLQRPDYGHTRNAVGFERPPYGANFMWSNASTDPEHLEEDVTVGQVFRMNLDAASFWNIASPGTFAAMVRSCDIDPPGARGCPRLGLRR